MQNKKIDVYDLDGTILAGNSFHLYMIFLAKAFARRANFLALLALCLPIGKRLLKLISHYELKQQIVAVAARLPLKEHQQFGAKVASLCRARLSGLEGERTEAGEARILATAAPSIYALHVGKLLGFQHVISSELRNDVLVETIAAEKLRAVQSFADDRNLTVECFFTDHYDDIHCAQIASRIVLVDPSERTVEEFARRNFEFSVHRFAT
jgi:phosphoserine phosphatase